MILYVLSLCYWYETSEVLGVYSSQDKANKAMKTELAFYNKEFYSVYSWEIEPKRADCKGMQMSYTIQEFVLDQDNAAV